MENCIHDNTGQIWQQAGGGSEGDRQHAGDGGIQGAAVANASEAVAAAQATDTGMGGETGRLVDHQKAAQGAGHSGQGNHWGDAAICQS